MYLKLIRLTPNIIHLKFKRKKDITRTLLRFQEHFEHPKFRGKIFSLDEFREWYSKDEKEHKFTYYTDWSGFNFPSRILKPFYAGKFDKLTIEEKQVLDLLRNEKGRFYVIGTFNSDDLKHEMAHAKFYTNARYRKEVLAVIDTIDKNEYYKELKKMGYDKSVLPDEAHAYLLETVKYFKSEFDVNPNKFKAARKALNILYRKYS